METGYKKKGKMSSRQFDEEAELAERFGSMFFWRPSMGKSEDRLAQLYGNEYGKKPMTAKERAEAADKDGIPVSPMRTMHSV